MMKIKELISEEKFQKRVKELSKKIEKDYEDKEINFVCTLKGAIFFMTDLARYINKNVKIDFVGYHWSNAFFSVSMPCRTE